MKPILFVGAIVTAFVIGSTSARAGCHINVTVVPGSESIQVLGTRSDVKSKGGSWRWLYSGGWSTGGSGWISQEFTDTYKATFGCGKNRRYRFEYSCASSANASRTKYYPSSTGWTKRDNIRVNLGC